MADQDGGFLTTTTTTKTKNDLSCNQSEWRGNPVLYFPLDLVSAFIPVASHFLLQG